LSSAREDVHDDALFCAEVEKEEEEGCRGIKRVKNGAAHREGVVARSKSIRRKKQPAARRAAKKQKEKVQGFSGGSVASSPLRGKKRV